MYLKYYSDKSVSLHSECAFSGKRWIWCKLRVIFCIRSDLVGQFEIFRLVEHKFFFFFESPIQLLPTSDSAANLTINDQQMLENVLPKVWSSCHSQEGANEDSVLGLYISFLFNLYNLSVLQSFWQFSWYILSLLAKTFSPSFDGQSSLTPESYLKSCGQCSYSSV